ncbi:MAG: helix-turn-helix transcriptional regulator [Thermomicrobia bacterium]|nr:helix-turn-helix transcriptional regulator [Thermomicrobia bacterium]MCA1723023.1 helix-turn-helix transcriptional regulator [Thermomicrobia bacterium]
MASGFHYDGSKMFALMTEQGRVLSWLADKTGYSVDTIYSMKQGRRAVTERFARRAADALDLPMSLLFAPIVLHESSEMRHECEVVA